MLIGELARLSGLSKDGLRHYESLGLIHSSPRRAGSRIYREYDDTTLIRLSLIALGKRLHIPLREMAAVIDDLIDESLSEAEVQVLLQGQLAKIDAKIADLEAARDTFARIMTNPTKAFVNPLLRDLGLMLDEAAEP